MRYILLKMQLPLLLLFTSRIFYLSVAFKINIDNPIGTKIHPPQASDIALKSWNLRIPYFSSQSDNKEAPKPTQYMKLISSGSKTPETTLSNNDLEKLVNTTDEWITTRTGISRRHILNAGESLSQMSIEAAKRALTNANLSPQDLDMIILATSTPDDLFGDASHIASSIGAVNACCYDLTAACSGFVFGLITATQFIENNAYKNIMVIGADGLSQWVDWEDRNTCILFGDGAGAVICQSTTDKTENGNLGWVMHSDGKKKQHLTLGNTRQTHKLNTELGHSLNIGRYNPIQMNGKDVFVFATREVPNVIKEALAKANLKLEDVDWVLLHQANQRILTAVAQKLNISPDKILSNVKEYGNTSAASIPICLDEAVSSNKLKKGDIIAMAGFGAGLSWGASIIKWGS